MTNNKINRKNKIKRIIDLLKFVLTLEDEELMKSSVESIIELLEEDINK